jgi:hypothetical protein
MHVVDSLTPLFGYDARWPMWTALDKIWDPAKDDHPQYQGACVLWVGVIHQS